MPAGGGVDQLRGNSHLVVRLAHAPFQHIAHAHLPAHVLHLDRLAFVGERGVAGDNKQTRDLGEVTGDIFRDSVAEVVLLGIFAYVDEGQDDDGGFVGQGKGLGAEVRGWV